MKLYHATFGQYKDSIEKNGLIPGFSPKNYENMYSDNCLYFAFDPDAAISYAESSENPEVNTDDIIVCVVNSSDLEADKISYDWNNSIYKEDEINSLQYSGGISPEKLDIKTEEEAIYDNSLPALDFYELKDYDADSFRIWRTLHNTYVEESEHNEYPEGRLARDENGVAYVIPEEKGKNRDEDER